MSTKTSYVYICIRRWAIRIRRTRLTFFKRFLSFSTPTCYNIKESSFAHHRNIFLIIIRRACDLLLKIFAQFRQNPRSRLLWEDFHTFPIFADGGFEKAHSGPPARNMTLARLAFFLLLHAESLFVAEVVVETLVVRRAPVIQLHACAFLVLLATFAKFQKKKPYYFGPNAHWPSTSDLEQE